MGILSKLAAFKKRKGENKNKWKAFKTVPPSKEIEDIMKNPKMFELKIKEAADEAEKHNYLLSLGDPEVEVYRSVGVATKVFNTKKLGDKIAFNLMRKGVNPRIATEEMLKFNRFMGLRVIAERVEKEGLEADKESKELIDKLLKLQIEKMHELAKMSEKQGKINEKEIEKIRGLEEKQLELMQQGMEEAAKIDESIEKELKRIQQEEKQKEKDKFSSMYV